MQQRAAEATVPNHHRLWQINLTQNLSLCNHQRPHHLLFIVRHRSTHIWTMADSQFKKKKLMRMNCISNTQDSPPKAESKPCKTTQNTEKVAHNPSFWLQWPQITEAGMCKLYQQVFFCRCVSLPEILAWRVFIQNYLRSKSQFLAPETSNHNWQVSPLLTPIKPGDRTTHLK